jgi:hypothetical protein
MALHRSPSAPPRASIPFLLWMLGAVAVLALGMALIAAAVSTDARAFGERHRPIDRVRAL